MALNYALEMESEHRPEGEAKQDGKLHSDFIYQAKLNQKRALEHSTNISQQLQGTIKALLVNHSSVERSSFPVIDKVNTIHQIDQEIHRQLREGIALNFDNLIEAKNRLLRTIQSSSRKLETKEVFKEEEVFRPDNIVDTLQRRVELIDRKLRILEDTIELVQKNNQSSQIG